jgi:hypothetical protein
VKDLQRYPDDYYNKEFAGEYGHATSSIAWRIWQAASAQLPASPPSVSVGEGLLAAAKLVLSNKRGEDDWLILSIHCVELEAAIQRSEASKTLQALDDESQRLGLYDIPVSKRELEVREQIKRIHAEQAEGQRKVMAALHEQPSGELGKSAEPHPPSRHCECSECVDYFVGNPIGNSFRHAPDAATIADLQARLEAAEAGLEAWRKKAIEVPGNIAAICAERNTLRKELDRLNNWQENYASECQRREDDLRTQLAAAQAVLARIADWELPSTGEFWENDPARPVSYEANHGSNGAREYIRNMARAATATDQTAAAAGSDE